MDNEIIILDTRDFDSDENIKNFRESNEISENEMSDERISDILWENLWEFDFPELINRFTNSFPQGFVLSGFVGLWNGNFSGGMIGYYKEEFEKIFHNCDYFKVFQEKIPHSNRYHLYINCYHHDGINTFEIKALTERGFNKATDENWIYGNELIKQLFKKNYSTYPILI